MPTDEKPEEEASSTPSKETVILLIATLADTTWRLFVPTVLGTILGLWADTTLETKPMFTIAATLLGILLSGLLVYAQIKRINKGNE